jgi:hypothetical protein
MWGEGVGRVEVAAYFSLSSMVIEDVTFPQIMTLALPCKMPDLKEATRKVQEV